MRTSAASSTHQNPNSKVCQPGPLTVMEIPLTMDASTRNFLLYRVASVTCACQGVLTTFRQSNAGLRSGIYNTIHRLEVLAMSLRIG